MTETTTIQISTATKDRLDAIKVHPREPYDSVVQRLLGLAEKKADKEKK